MITEQICNVNGELANRITRAMGGDQNGDAECNGRKAALYAPRERGTARKHWRI